MRMVIHLLNLTYDNTCRCALSLKIGYPKVVLTVKLPLKRIFSISEAKLSQTSEDIL